ncbi:hypothetical protein CAEBREN_02619 [Caenorhabditis brenneri]|uniref:Uncharacterized protein n=1 Tax=Caenorhabditis brenneri TaxID=135651 RepID=G0MV17_CAEBE|nr:hypothetical protein CAEBREN_02619 [Caenorhabditis brenneri]
MQRSFELLGIRKPPSPPLPEEPDQVFEHMMNQLIDQVEVQNHHGNMLQLQAELLVEELKIKQYLSIADRDAGSIIRADPLIKELTDQFQNVHEQSERSFIQAQIQVLKWKIIYTRLQNREYFMTETVRASFMQSIPVTLSAFSKFLNRDKRSQIRSQKVTLGDREIDEFYRRITALATERSQPERPRNLNENAVWLQEICQLNNILERFPRDIRILDQRPRPDNLRVVSNQAKFRLIDEFIIKFQTGKSLKFEETSAVPMVFFRNSPNTLCIFKECSIQISKRRIRRRWNGTVEKLLELADYLESETLEAICIQHLGQKSEFSLTDQFEMAETYHSEKLMIQICASIKDAYELDKVVPKELDSLCNTTKNLVMQRSFELLGIRRPPSPPLPEDPDQVFENRMNQIIDQVEIQNLRGEILKDQIELLVEDVLLKQYLSLTDKDAGRMFRDDPLMNELTDQLRYVHEQSEKNFIQAQIQVLKWKIIYARLQNREFIMDENIGTRLSHAILGILTSLAPFLNRDKRSQSRSHKVTLGDREIDEIYRRITAEAIERSQPERPRNLDDNAVWLQKINFFNSKLERSSRHVHIFAPRSRPDNLRVVSDQASFRLINELVSNARNVYYTTVRENQPEPNGAVEGQNPQEQDQEQN